MFESSLVPLNNLQEFQVTCTAQNTFSIKDFFSKRDQIRWKLQIWSHLLRKNLMENIIFGAVMDPRQRRKIMKTFICSQFRYYPLIWMFYSKKISNTVKSLHKLFLKVISRDYKQLFRDAKSSFKYSSEKLANIWLLLTINFGHAFICWNNCQGYNFLPKNCLKLTDTKVKYEIC